MLSVFIPGNTQTYKSCKSYPNCAIKGFRHPPAPESTRNLFPLLPECYFPEDQLASFQKYMNLNNPLLKKIWIGPATVEKTSSAAHNPCFIQFGGMPVFIEEKPVYLNNLHNDAYQFVLQMDEMLFPDEILPHRKTPFDFGIVYLYGRLREYSLSDIIAGFWQCASCYDN